MNKKDSGYLAVQETKKTLQKDILEVIKTKRFTQGEAAFIAKTTQPKISLIVNNKLNGMSIDYLMATLARLEQ